jgi:hypothetical protein
VEALMGRAGERALVPMRVKTPKPRKHGRVCQVQSCLTFLSVYNIESRCSVHARSEVIQAIDSGRWTAVDWQTEWLERVQAVIDADGEAHVRQWALAEATFKALKAGVKATELAARARAEHLPGKYKQDVSKFGKAWERFGGIPLEQRPGLWDACKTPIGQEPTTQYTRVKASMNNPLKAVKRVVKLLADGQALSVLRPEEREELLALVPTLREELDRLESGELVAVAS